MPRSTCLLALLAAAPPLLAQPVTWQTQVTAYGDNTEFFTPYRVGETIFGGQFMSRLVGTPSSRYRVHLGVFGDVRWGSNKFLDRVRPILSVRYQTATSLGVVGTLETDRRHGLMDALAVSTLELTRPIEYGLQWRERRRVWEAEAFVNSQAVNTATEDEAFDYGWVLRAKPIRQLALVHQLHGLHRGDQLGGSSTRVPGGVGSALGIELADSAGRLGEVSLGVYRLWSSRPDSPDDRPGGRGTMVRGGVGLVVGAEVFGILWRGRDFLSPEGDNNYNSAGYRADFYRSRRKYLELGVLRRSRLEGDLSLDAELRLHRVDDVPSDALFGSRWEYSYRLVLRAPFNIRVH